MLLGNANVNYDPDFHITDKAQPVSIGVIAGARCVSTASFDPVYEGEAMFDTICNSLIVISIVANRPGNSKQQNGAEPEKDLSEYGRIGYEKTETNKSGEK
jgi:hypothetical protein